MYLRQLTFKNHPVLKDISFDFVNNKTNKPYSIVLFVGENGSGKTTVLNEIFKFNESNYIVNKEQSFDKNNEAFKASILRAGIKSDEIERNVKALIDGSENKRIPDELIDKKAVCDTLNNDRISNVINKSELDLIHCGETVTRLISGESHQNNIENYSAGEQEILLKIRDILRIDTDVDCILIDEPETSLHPIWQRKIFKLFLNVISQNREEIPQIFVATQSERVLESLVKRNDVLVFRLFKENGKFVNERVDKMKLMLSQQTFEELDYLAFHIPSFKYHDLLFYRFGEVVGLKSKAVCEIDNSIYENAKQLFGEQNIEVYKKDDRYKFNNEWKETKMLPAYVRNRYHHPDKNHTVSEEQLEKSILFLRELISKIKNN